MSRALKSCNRNRSICNCQTTSATVAIHFATGTPRSGLAHTVRILVHAAAELLQCVQLVGGLTLRKLASFPQSAFLQPHLEELDKELQAIE